MDTENKVEVEHRRRYAIEQALELHATNARSTAEGRKVADIIEDAQAIEAYLTEAPTNA